MEKNETHSKIRNETEPNLEKIPKTKFEQLGIDRETTLFYDFMKGGRWSAVFDRVYPELRKIKEESKDKKECLKEYKKFLENLRQRDGEKMASAQAQIQLEWGKVGPGFLSILSEHFETDWPEDKREIVGYVSALPVFPRFLDEYTFCVGYKNVSRAIVTSAHEIVHFLWFKKWHEVFPETDREEFESPYLVWRLSEIMDPIILHCNPKINELIKPRDWGYSSFESIKIGDMSMTEYFKKIYLQSIANGDDFATTLKKLLEEAKKHEKEISRF